MAAYAALVSLINNIEQSMSHPRLSASLDDSQMKTLLEKASLLLGFIEGYRYNYGGGSREEVADLERRIAVAAHAAEDAIESHIVDRIHAESASSGLSLRVRRKVRDLKKKVKHLNRRIRSAAREDQDQSHAGSIQVCRSSLHLEKAIEDMDAVLKNTRALMEKEELQLQLQLQSREELPSNSRMPAMEATMVGFEDELIQLKDKLTNLQASHHVVSIVGMGGMGKTTLAHNLYHDSLIKQYFDVRAWATVSQQYNVRDILSQLLCCLGKSSSGSSVAVEDLKDQLHKTLFGRRYLIILDDIWTVEVWEQLRLFFPGNRNGSRIVLTTRLSNVANSCGSFCFMKNLLDEDKSWELFCEKAFGREDGCPSELEEVGKEIVELCKGLPLSIVVIGGSLLKSPRTVGHWKHVALDIKSVPDSKEKQESLDVLFSSYHHLPPHLKPCFLYIGVLKKFSSKIYFSEIIKLWVAEGFLKSNGGQVLEEIAEDYLKELIDRNLILVVSRSDSGKMKCCEIHDLVRDLCLKVAEEQEFIHVVEGVARGMKRRLVYTSSMMKGNAEFPLARSIMASSVGKQKLDKHRLLRILDVRQYASVKKSLGRVNLRYLALDNPISWKFQRVWKIPTSVSLVWNLQTLTINYSYWSPMVVVAPIEIWAMRHLRHIQCTRIYLPHPCSSEGQDDLFIWESLQSLKTAQNLRLSKEVCKIIPNIKKLYLLYNGESQGYDDGMIDCLCNLSQLHKLESLKLIAESKWLTRSPKLSKILTFPTSLNKLSLRDCQLHWDDLEMIGLLPLLEVLKLESNSVTEGEQWNPVVEQFPRLKFLKLYNCNLVRWNAESSHFPVLETLALACLSELEEIPSDIGDIPTLKLIHVHLCSKSAVISAAKIKEEQLELNGNDDLQIQVMEYNSDLETEMD